MRLSTALVRGPQLKRWYSAELPNSSSDVAMNTALAHLAGAPCASTISTMPAAIAIGKVAAWIQPRHDGLSSTWALAAAASSSGSWGISAPSSVAVTGRAYAAAHAAPHIRGRVAR